MNPETIAHWRMHNLLLTSTPSETPEDVIRWLGAVQSQDYGPAKWSVAQRTNGFDDASMDQAFDEGRILRTHALRPTWHFLHPEDIRLALQVTGPRVQVSNGHRYRQLELDENTLNRCNELIIEAIEGGTHLTRKEIGAMLESEGINVDGQRLPHILMNAELEGIICSGALKGKQHTYALLDERAPNARQYDDPDEALAEFTLRYFTSHGPATMKDLRAWSSLTIAQIKQGISMVESELEQMEFDGLTFWYVHGPPSEMPPSPSVHLLQGYDEYFMGYLESRYVVDVARRVERLHPDQMIANGALVIDSQLAGHWKRTMTTATVSFEVFHYDPLDDAQVAAIQQEADRFGAFLGRDAAMVTSQI